MENLFSTILFSPSVNSLLILAALRFQVGLDEMLNTENLRAELSKLLLFGTDAPSKQRTWAVE